MFREFEVGDRVDMGKEYSEGRILLGRGICHTSKK